ncbi:MAG: late competence development ComFB family protein [Lachnospiraceae bacterium]
MERLVNVMEEKVCHMIDDTIGSLGCCTCEKCKKDIAAYVLNRTTPKYVVSEKGELFSKVSNLDSNSNMRLLMEITRAADVIAKNPHHDKSTI